MLCAKAFFFSHFMVEIKVADQNHIHTIAHTELKIRRSTFL